MNMQTQDAPKFVRYVANSEFTIGTPPQKVYRGTLIDFDGFLASFGGAPPVQLPQFRSAIKAEWVVLEDSYDPHVVPRAVAANIKVRPADGGDPRSKKAFDPSVTVAAEEREVSIVGTHAQAVRDNNRQNYRRVNMASDVEPQDGRVVRAVLKTSVNREDNRVVLGTQDERTALNQASRVQIDPGKGRTREDLLARMDPEQRAIYEAEIASRRSAYVADTDHHVVATINPSQETRESLGIVAGVSFGEGSDTVDLNGLDSGTAHHAVAVAEGITFSTTNVAPRRVTPANTTTEDPRRVIARAVCKDFPVSYDFNAPIKKRLARLQADFEDRPDVIRAVAAAETDSDMRSALLEEFPGAFA